VRFRAVSDCFRSKVPTCVLNPKVYSVRVSAVSRGFSVAAMDCEDGDGDRHQSALVWLQPCVLKTRDNAQCSTCGIQHVTVN
jgi:hypothetical protein